MKTSIVFDMLKDGWLPCFDLSKPVIPSKVIGWMVVHYLLYPIKV